MGHALLAGLDSCHFTTQAPLPWPLLPLLPLVQTRDPNWAPEVLSAQVAVRLRMGLLRRILYSLRPSALPMLLLGAAALASILGGSTAAAICFALWLYTLWGARESAEPGRGGAAGEEDGSGSVLSGAEGEELAGSVSGLSEVESGGWKRPAGPRAAWAS